VSNCIDGNDHGEIIRQIDDNGPNPRYDPSVLATCDHRPRPDPMLWGYCVDCHQGFRWSVTAQQWRPWPGRLAKLPELTDEELDELHLTLLNQIRELNGIRGMCQNVETSQLLEYRLSILMSLNTAVQEARWGLFPPA
jgi:hypothetical protein